DPATGTPKACASNTDCKNDNLCVAARCIKGTCYAVSFPENEPCDVGSICRSNVCTKIAQLYTPPTGIDPITLVSVVVIVMVLGVIAWEYFKKS
ncbi:MAG: hypothetical protein Q7R47_04625, partial [Candidatus Diapherotrites archaeon]|nr:hypothetical protein [Candidatus Diapherotrites archaeon]